jgi:hypothetical protein
MTSLLLLCPSLFNHSQISLLFIVLNETISSEASYQIKIHHKQVIRTGLFHGEVDNIILTPQYVSRLDKSDKIREIHCRNEREKNSFFPRTIKDHNKQ